MYLFVWSGKGYRVMVDTFLVFPLFGLVIQFSQGAIPDRHWYWALALAASGIAIWFDGRRLNVRKRNAVRSTQARHKIFYRARHTAFMMPMETFGYAVLAAAIIWFGVEVMPA